MGVKIVIVCMCIRASLQCKLWPFKLRL